MRQDKVLEGIEKYIKTSLTDYAIMIEGAWGAGKTYFFKNEICKLIEDNNQIPIYVSLIGCSSLESLKRSIFSKINPFYQDEIYSKVHNEAIYLENLLTNKVSSSNSIPSNVVLCFDDLERINIRFLEEAMGYINNFVEHESIKTIFLCNPVANVLNTKSFREKKEKYIRYSYYFESYIDNVLPDHLTDKSLIKATNDKFRNKNIRTCLYFLALIFDIENELQDELRDLKHNEKIKKSLEIFIIIWSIAVKSKQLKLEDLEDACDQYSTMSSPKQDNFGYLKKRIYDLIQSIDGGEIIFYNFKSISKCVKEQGYCDQEKLIDEIRNLDKEYERREEVKALEQVKSYNKTKVQRISTRLYSASTLTKDSYEQLLEDIISALKEHIFSAKEIIEIFSALVNIESYKINGVDISTDIIKQFEDSMKFALNKPKEEIKHPNLYYWNEETTFSKKVNDFVDFSFGLGLINKDIESNQAVKRLLTLIDSGKEFSQEDLEAINFMDWNDENMTRKFFESLKNGKAENINSYIDYIDNKYSLSATIRPSKVDEKSFILGLYDLVHRYLEESQPRDFRIISFAELERKLSELIRFYRLNHQEE